MVNDHLIETFGILMMMILIPLEHLDGTQWEYIKALADLQPLTTWWWLAILLFNATASGVLGALGLIFLRQHWAEKSAAPVPPVITPPLDLSAP